MVYEPHTSAADRFGRLSALLGVVALFAYGWAFLLLGRSAPRLPYPLFMASQFLPYVLSIAAVVNVVRSRSREGRFTGWAILGILLSPVPWIIAITLAYLFVGFGRSSGGGP